MNSEASFRELPVRIDETVGARILTWSAYLFSGGFAASLLANPQGLSVVNGSASISSGPSTLRIEVGAHATLDWRTFNINPGETTTFVQPSAQSVVINRVQDVNPSLIWGGLSANGTVILANPHGIYFGPNSMVSVGGSFLATTASLPADFGINGVWSFTGMPPVADIVNYGTLESRGGGSVFLIAERVENHGTISAPEGGIWLAAGQEVLVSERPDGRGVSAQVTVPTGSVDNYGRLTADAGTIGLHARVVNQSGVIQADSVRMHNGTIELVASEELNLSATSRISARGDNSGTSSGGNVTLQSTGFFHDHAGSRIEIQGGSNGGSGGSLEISAPRMESLASALTASAQPGFAGGRLLLDPQDIELSTSGTGAIGGDGTVGFGGGGTLSIDVTSAFHNGGFSDITLAATRNITLKQGTVWNLSDSTGLSGGQHQLTLRAGQDVVFENNARITDASGWSVRLQAGYDFTAHQVVSGIGSVFLNGGFGKSLNGAIDTALGDIELTAGKDVLVGTGYVRTTGGGSIQVHALSGDIDAGKKNDNYDFTPTGYRVAAAGPGGITTTHGGDVSLTAGNDIRSVPTLSSSQPNPGGSGALGAEPGDVLLNAGHLISGNFFLRNGTGTVLSGVAVTDGKVSSVLNPDADIGGEKSPVSLSLVTGTWNLWAARDIYLSEIRNPNGTFNRNRLPVNPTQYSGNVSGGIGDGTLTTPPEKSAFLFDYAADSAAHLWSGHGITLLGANLPRVLGQNQTMKAVYPAQLSLETGAGGIDVENSLVLFPSSQGALSITTHDGGDLRGRQLGATLTGITISDSGMPDFNSFQDGHARIPRHLNDPDRVMVDIAGGIENFSLSVPTAASVSVGGSTYNFGFRGQNLSTDATTRIQVAGDIVYRGNLTETPIEEPLPAAFFNPLLVSNPQLIQRVLYSATTGTLGFTGQMSPSDLAYLQSPSLLVFDSTTSAPVLDPSTGLQKTTSLTLSAVQKAAFDRLYADSQTASLGDQGLSLAGPGRFVVQAHNADLGISAGITVKSPNTTLASISPLGASLQVDLSGDLSMTSTRISNESYLGSVQVNTAGKVQVGGVAGGLADAGQVRGIFSTSGGNVAVAAGGDIDVNGSRIATYNGGNISVRSTVGDINAGSGGTGFVTVNALEQDPLTGSLHTVFGDVPGSGILTATLRDGHAQLGGIQVNADSGSINANLGGFIQLGLNAVPSPDAGISLEAHRDIDASGSGVIGRNVSLKAGGDVRGLIIGRGRVDISGQNVAVNAVSSGSVNINASGTVSGSVTGGGSVSVSGDSISAALVSKSVNASGDTSAASVGVPTSAGARTEARISDDPTAPGARNGGLQTEDSDEKRKRLAGSARVTRLVGRVTVLLPETPAKPRSLPQ